MDFTKKELKDLFFAWLIISLAFAILLSGSLSLSSLAFSFLLSSLTVGISFIAHELMHKYFAQKYGFKAHFVAFYNMLFLALAFSFLGFIIAAPGAVYIIGRMSNSQNGKISLAGPATNLVLALLSISLLFLVPKSLLSMLFYYSFSINTLLASFNLLPIMPFDGKKVYNWSKPVYFTALALALTMLIIWYAFGNRLL